MVEQTFTLTNPSGLHTRPAALFVKAVQQFPSTEVLVIKGAATKNGRSLLAILSLGVTAGTAITIRCSGPQEQEAMAALRALIERGFGE